MNKKTLVIVATFAPLLLSRSKLNEAELNAVVAFMRTLARK
ncbi:MAG: hypothetical protein QOI24_4039 [Acidobacteriota bacterium]|jgi:hypothetical protein|nr:hypothetical protein [Acidobacteriota bacterium]